MKIIPNVPVVYNSKFPKDFVNDVAGWGFTREELSKNIGKLLNLYFKPFLGILQKVC